MLSVQNISKVAVTMKFDQGHQNSYVNITFKGGYPEAKLERSRLESVYEGPKINVSCEIEHEKQFAMVRR